MKTLSTANQANIADRVQRPVIKIDLTNQSKKWSYGEATGYDPIIISMSTITHSIDPYGGLGEYSDFSFSIQKEPSQIIQTDDLDNEPVTVNVQYGSDADIPVWAGVVDNWSYGKGVLTLNCISKLVLKGTTLPIQQINSTNYSTFNIPADMVGRWVPFTIGSPYRPAGLQAAYGADTTSKYVFNAPVSGHEAIGVFPGAAPRFYAWNGNAKRWLEETNSTGIGGGSTTNGYIGVRLGLQMWTKNIQPYDAAWTLDGSSAGGSDANPENAIDANTTTYAELDNPAPDNTTTGGDWTGTFPDLPYGAGHDVASLYFKGKVEKQNAVNHGGRTAEEFRVGIEVVPGTAPDADQFVDLLPSGTSFNNIDGADAETARAWVILNFSDVLGDEINGNSVTFPIDKLSQLKMHIDCIEEDVTGGGDETDYFRIHEAGLTVLCNVAHFQYKRLFSDLDGYDDDSSGTYTGSANSLIETPVDVVYFILGEIFGHTGFDTTAVSAARTALGSYIIAGQFFDVIGGEDAMLEILANSRMSAWIDYEDNWTFKHWELPGSADKTFSQNAGDLAEEEIAFIGQSPSENVYNQFEILYGWNEAEQRFNDVLVLNESSGGAIGTWLTDSQTDYNITRKMVFEARWINDDDTATSFGNYLIYRYADRKRVARWKTGFNGLEMELLDRVILDHQDITATDPTGESDPQFEIYSIETDLVNGIITFEGMQADTSHAALTDPT